MDIRIIVINYWQLFWHEIIIVMNDSLYAELIKFIYVPTQKKKKIIYVFE